MSATSSNKDRRKVQDRVGTAIPGAMLVLVVAVVGSCVPLAGEHVPPVIVTDTSEKLTAMKRITSELNRPPKQVHLSVKLVVLSDADAEKVRTYILKDARPANSRSVDRSSKESREWYDPVPTELGSLDFAKFTAFLNFIRMKTRGSIIQAPQVIALDHEEATISVGELFRRLEAFRGMGHAEPSGSKPKGPPFSPDIRLLVIPHVTGPDNNVILTVIPKTEPPKSAELFQVFEGGPLGQLKLPLTFRRTVVTKGMLRDRPTGMGLFRRVAVTKIMLRDRDTAMLSGLRGQWRGETVNVLLLLTPTVIDFERKVIRDSIKRAQEE